VKLAVALTGFLGFVTPLAAAPVIPQCVQATLTQYIAENSCLVGNVLYAGFAVNAFGSLQGVTAPFSTNDIIVTPSVLSSGTALSFSSVHFNESRTDSEDIQLSYHIEPQDIPPVIDDFWTFLCWLLSFLTQDQVNINTCYGDSFAADGSCAGAAISQQFVDKAAIPLLAAATTSSRLVPVYELGQIIDVHLGPTAAGGGFDRISTAVHLVPQSNSTPVTLAADAAQAAPESGSAPLMGVALAFLLAWRWCRAKAPKLFFHFPTRV
jgi:hypothetical protein